MDVAAFRAERPKPPMFPDVMIERGKGYSFDNDVKQDRALISTCTMRPPVIDGRGQTFSVVVQGPAVAAMSDDELLAHGRDEMQRSFKRAHPDGCPETH